MNFLDHGFVGGMSLREEDSLGVCAFPMGEALAVGGFSLGASLPCLCFLIEAGSAGFGLLAASQASSHSLQTSTGWVRSTPTLSASSQGTSG
jgi:hypothetical protein